MSTLVNRDPPLLLFADFCPLIIQTGDIYRGSRTAVKCQTLTHHFNEHSVTGIL